MRNNESRLRDLARKLMDVAREHAAYSQVVDVMNHVNNHLNALAYIEEVHVRANDARSPAPGVPD